MTSKELYQERKAKHLCVYCGRPAPNRLTCDACKAKIDGYAKHKSKWHGRPQKPVETQEPVSTFEFGGEVIEIAKLSMLPKSVYWLMGPSVSDVVSRYSTKFRKQPKIIYVFRRQVGGDLYYTEFKESDEQISINNTKERAGLEPN